MQDCPCHVAIEISLANPFWRNLEKMVADVLVLPVKIACFPGYEIECEDFQIT